MKSRPIRVRLTLHYTGVLAAALLVYGGGLYLELRQHGFADLDRRLQEDIEAAVLRIEVGSDGRLRWLAASGDRDVPEEPEGGHWVEVWTSSGERVLQAATGAPLDIGGPPQPDGGQSTPQSITLRTARVRVLTREARVAGVPLRVRAAISESAMRWQLRELLRDLALLFPAVLGLAAAGGYMAARRALRPLSEMAARAHRITAERLADRLPVGARQDELSALGAAFNEAFARLERSFEQLRRFTADASHELRTPLTALRSVGEVGLGAERGAAEYREVIGSMLEEVDRLTRLVDSLLKLSRADAGQFALHPEPLDLGELAREVVTHLAVLAEDRGQLLEVEAGPAPVRGDRIVLRQALINLVDNAIEHSPRDAAIQVRSGRREVSSFVDVADSGPGIPREHQDRVFDRFYRVDPGRSRDRGGAGLGLAVARWAVEAHGGRIELESDEGKGSTFRIVLPAAGG